MSFRPRPWQVDLPAVNCSARAVPLKYTARSTGLIVHEYLVKLNCPTFVRFESASPRDRPMLQFS